jgi:glyoxylase-like metal-dependent hydrolase (beta-lactamase superfamily II)
MPNRAAWLVWLVAFLPVSVSLASPQSDPIRILPVQGNVYMLVGAGGNITMSVGPDGILLVDTGTEEMAEATADTVFALARAVTASPAPNRCVGLYCPQAPFGWTSPGLNAVISSPAPPKPIRYIINTSMDAEHTGGNALLSELPPDSPILAVTFPPITVIPTATVIAHENVFVRMSQPDETGEAPTPLRAWPTETFHVRSYELSHFFNGEGVKIYHQPANTDGNSIVYFRFSDVISAGDIISASGYPTIDPDSGGSIQGVLDGLNLILDIAIPEFRAQGGTMIVPGHGRLMDTGDVTNYRNMVAIVRDRVQGMMEMGMTLDEIQSARPTLDYDGLYSAEAWTGEMFVAAVYRSLAP